LRSTTRVYNIEEKNESADEESEFDDNLQQCINLSLKEELKIKIQDEKLCKINKERARCQVFWKTI